MEYSPVPNQRRVTIHKVDQPQFYTKIDPASCKQAMGSLHYSAFKLYMYFCLNATNFVLFPTPSVFCDEISLPRNTYYAAFDELREKGYLVSVPGKPCLFDFYENPCLHSANTTSPKTRTQRTRKQESPYQKPAENTYKTMNQGHAVAMPLDNDTCTASPTRNEEPLQITPPSRIFFGYLRRDRL